MFCAASAAGFICGCPIFPGPGTRLVVSYSGPSPRITGFSAVAVASIAPGSNSISSPGKPTGLCIWSSCGVFR